MQCRGAADGAAELNDTSGGAWALYPSQQLTLLDAAGVLSDVPEESLVGLAAAAASVPCALEAWEVWSRMRRLGTASATTNRPLLLALMQCFLVAELPVPCWEIYAAMRRPLPPGPLPRLDDMKRIFIADGPQPVDIVAIVAATRTAALSTKSVPLSEAYKESLEPSDASLAHPVARTPDASRALGAARLSGIRYDDLSRVLRTNLGEVKFASLQRRVTEFEAAMKQQTSGAASIGEYSDEGAQKASKLAAAMLGALSQQLMPSLSGTVSAGGSR